MAIGLVLLAVVAILMFFGLGSGFLNKIGLSSWLAFIFILLLVAGAVVPVIKTADNSFLLNVGGFIVPLILSIIFIIMSGAKSDVLRSLVAVVAVAGIYVAVRMLMMPVSFSAVITSSVIVGFVGGAVAYLVGVTRLSTLAASFGGIVLGDLLVAFVMRYFLGGSVFALGASGAFDAAVLSAVFGIILLEAVTAIKKTALKRSPKNVRAGNMAALTFEAAEDNKLSIKEIEKMAESEDFSKYFEKEEKTDDDEAAESENL